MTGEANLRVILSFKVLSRAASVIVMLVGFLVLVGWAFDFATLKSVFPGMVTMKVNTALAFILAGGSLWLRQTKRTDQRAYRLAQGCAGAVVLIGALTLSEYLLGRGLGIDQLLFQESSAAVGTSNPGRMAPNTALNFLLIGIALLSLDLETRRGHRPAQFLTIVAALVSLLALTGYAYGVASFYGIATYTRMALHTTVAFLALCAGILFARPDRGLMVIVTSGHAGGVLVRRLLPAVIGVLLAAGWIRLAGQRAGFYGTEFGTAILVVSCIVILGVLVWRSAETLDRMDTERKRVKEEHDRFFDLSLDMLCIASFDGYFKYLNPAWEKTLGWTKEELFSKPYLEFVHSEDRESTVTEAQKLSSGGVTIVFENRYLCKNGSYKWLQWKAIPFLERQLIYATARDVTERKQSEEALRTSERRLADALDIAEAAIVSVDENQRICLFDQRAERIFGYTASEVLARPLDLLLPFRFAEAHRQHMSNFAGAPETARRMGERRDVFGRRKDGTEFPAEAAISKLSQNGQTTFTAVLRDITERKRAEEMLKSYAAQLEAANKELEAFSYSVSHDLRAPLRSIDGFSQALLEDYADKLDAGGQDHLHRVRAAIQRMAQLIDDMLNLSRVTRSEMRYEAVDLSALAQTVATELQKMQPERQVEFVIPKGIVTNGDARMLEVVLENLLTNAWKFSGKKPRARVEFGVTEHDGKPAYFVRDDGAGFDMAYANKLFGAFQRLHGVKDFPGTGIGLATVSRIIHRHGGRVWARGEVDQGATFYFTL